MSKLTIYFDWFWEILKLQYYWFFYIFRGVIIVGFFPSTTAVYAITRQWLLYGDKEKLSVDFKKYYRENFKIANLLGWSLILFSLIIYLNWVYIPYVNQSILKLMMYGIVIFFTILFVIICLYLFPVISNFRLQWMNYFIVGARLGFSSLPYTILQIVLLTGITLLYYSFPKLTVLFGIVPMAFIQMFICNHVFSKLTSE